MGDDTNPYNIFDYTESRSREGPDEFSNGFRGYPCCKNKRHFTGCSPFLSQKAFESVQPFYNYKAHYLRISQKLSIYKCWTIRDLKNIQKVQTFLITI